MFFTLELKAKPEQDILKKLIDETEKNRMPEELLDTFVMETPVVKEFDEVSFDYSQAPSYA